MPKYYVQCSCYQLISNSNDAQQAALGLIDRVLQSHLWIYDDDDLSDDERRDHLMLEALMHLDSSIRVSEQGFDRHDATLIGTPESILQWHQLVLSVTRMFIASGLSRRSMATIGALPFNGGPLPRLPR